MLDANIKTQLAAYLEKLQAPSNSSPRSTTAMPRARCASCCRHRRTVAQGRRAHRWQATPASRRSPSAARARRRASALPASRWATSSPRWCWPCCRPAAIRPRSMPAVIEQIKAHRPLPLRDLHLAVLPQLPGRGAGAQPDGRAEPRRRERDDRRRPVPGRSECTPDHGRADRDAERRTLRPGPHDHRGNPRQGGYRRLCPRRRKARTRKDAYDVLVVGGGPAGAAAAIYAARKGIRTGVVAERFGGQVLDTLGIENFISVQRTEGPKLAMALEQHVKEYEVDIMNLQRAGAGSRPVGWPASGAARQRRHAQGEERDPRHRRALARDERARREGLQGQGRLLLPALRRPAVQGQARGGDRRRQLRRRGGDRPRRHRRPRHAARIRQQAARRRGVAGQARQPAQRHGASPAR
jgi:hypothetical protein